MNYDITGAKLIIDFKRYLKSFLEDLEFKELLKKPEHSFASGFCAGMLAISQLNGDDLNRVKTLCITLLDAINKNSYEHFDEFRDMQTLLKDTSQTCIQIMFEEDIPPSIKVSLDFFLDDEVVASDNRRFLIHRWPKDFDSVSFESVLRHNQISFAFAYAKPGAIVDYIGDKTWKATRKGWVAA